MSDWPEGFGFVSLPEVLREAGARYGARTMELRKRGHKIEIVVRVQPSGEQWPFYRLVHDAELYVASPELIPETMGLFGDLRPEHRDE